MQRIRPAVTTIRNEIGLEHALASKKLYTDGVEVIYDYAETEDDPDGMTVVRTKQQHFREIIRDYLKCITYAGDGYASEIHLSLFESTPVVVNPKRNFGLPSLKGSRVRLEDLVDRFQAGDRIGEIAADFEIDPKEVEDVIRVALAA